jgi:hypothetical protein
MTLRFGLAQMVVATGLVASLGVTTFARDDDPRDFKRNDNRYESRSNNTNRTSSSARNNSQNERNRNDDERDRNNYGRNNNNNNNQNHHNSNDRDRDDRDRDDREEHENRPKVTICHRSERDDDDDDDDRRRAFSAKTIQVSQNAVNAHLAHGDTLGPCAVSPFASQRPYSKRNHRDR